MKRKNLIILIWYVLRLLSITKYITHITATANTALVRVGKIISDVVSEKRCKKNENKKCFDICKKSGVFMCIKPEYDEQWLSDGSACPITGFTNADRSSICKLYDINDTQRNKCCFEFLLALLKS